MLKNLLLLLFVLLLTALGLEAVMRATHLFGARLAWSMPDAVLGWRFVPSGNYLHLKENDHPVAWKTNRWGWRGEDWSLEKPKDVYRVAALGDSFLEGLQVEQKKHFLTLTENEWNAKKTPKVEFMNFGRSDFTQSEEMIVLDQDVLRFSPDMAVLFFLPMNDIEDISPATSPNPMRPYFIPSPGGSLQLDTSFSRTREFKLKKLIDPLKRRSFLVSLLTERFSAFSALERARGKKNQASGTLPRYLTLATKNPDPQFLENYKLNKRLITEMAFLCRSKGIRFVLAVNDNPAYLPEAEEKYRTLDDSFDPDFFEKDLRDFAASLGIGFIGLQTPFKEEYRKNRTELHFPAGKEEEETGLTYYVGHWNYAGHELVARSLYNGLEQEFADRSAAA